MSSGRIFSGTITGAGRWFIHWLSVNNKYRVGVLPMPLLL
jgi:hypothetical protein